jgi:hypothetical protein
MRSVWSAEGAAGYEVAPVRDHSRTGQRDKKSKTKNVSRAAVPGGIVSLHSTYDPQEATHVQ